MFFWLIGILLMGGLGAAGRAVGALRYAIVLLGLWISHFVAFGFAGKLTDYLLNRSSKLANPLYSWVLPPILLYAISAIIFIIIAQVVYSKVLVYYKYKVLDERRVAWERMDRGLGISMGVAVGATLLIELGILIYSVGYWTTQTEASSPEENPAIVKIVNPLKNGLRSSGLEPLVASLDPNPDLFYDIADVVGLVYNNPRVKTRLTTYPGTLTMSEAAIYKEIADDTGIQEAIDGQSNFATLISSPKLAAIIYSPSERGGLFALDWKDLKAYLETGDSPKYKGEKILGRWGFSRTGTVVKVGELLRPGAGTDEQKMNALGQIRKQLPIIAPSLQFLAGGNHTVMLKGRITGIDDLKSLVEGRPLTKAPATAAPKDAVLILNGTWEGEPGDYTITWEGDNGSGKAELQESRDTYTIPLGKGWLVFRK